MEQRKLLWVILLVSLFVLITFGAALFLYSPARSGNTAYADGEDIAYEGGQYGENHSVDPDKWTREPDQVAELDKKAAPAAGNIINLTIVNDGQPRNDKNIDVSDLTENTQNTESTLPPELAAQIGISSAPEKENTAEKTEAASIKNETQKSNSSSQKQDKKVKPVKPQKKKAVAKNVKKSPKQQTIFWVQTASLTNRINAEKARDRLAAEHMQVEIFTKKTASGLTYRVRVGPFVNKAEAQYWLNNIKKIKDFSESYISQSTVKR